MKNSKQILIIIIIVILIIIADIIVENFTKNVVDVMNDKLEEIDELLIAGEFPNEKVEELIEEWNKKEKIISCYLEHEEVDEIGIKINLLKSQIEIEDYDDARQGVAEMIFLFEHIADKQKLNLKNFF